MYDELTEVDIRKMREEMEYRIQVLRPKLIEDVQTARAFGDLSENFEYKCAKQEKNRNESRIRYLERMIRTAKVISADSAAAEVGLFDKVTLFNPGSVGRPWRGQATYGVILLDKGKIVECRHENVPALWE